MPRSNQPRSLQSEDNVARRIAQERARLGWSYEGLAERMTLVGCPIQPSGLYKIEKQGRRITVAELVAFSLVFATDVVELLEDPELVADEAAKELVKAWHAAKEQERAALHRIVEHVKQFPDAEPLIEKYVTPGDREGLLSDARRGLERVQRSGVLKGMTAEDMDAAHDEAKKQKAKSRRPGGRRGQHR
jgi:transcriptional regulator with XRE-family HTH domain